MSVLPAPQNLRYVVALAEAQHFGRAAAACRVTQSTLSAGLIVLERQIDAAILDRSAGKRVVFTPLGHEIVARAREALAALEAVREAADAARAPMTGPLRLGVIPTIGPFLLPRFMPALRAAIPPGGAWSGCWRTGWMWCCWRCLAIAAMRQRCRWCRTSFLWRCRRDRRFRAWTGFRWRNWRMRA
jgi:hypothetical protein